MNYLTQVSGAGTDDSSRTPPQLVGTCPRCDARNITFGVTSYNATHQEYGWQWHYEVFAICTGCCRSTVFLLEDLNLDTQAAIHRMGGMFACTKTLNNFYRIEGYVSLKHSASVQPPEHVPEEIAAVFREGATCVAVECWNAASAMFRLCVDLATIELLPEEDEGGLTSKIRTTLGLRLAWLFKIQRLAADLHDLSTCIKDDGNDGVHRGTLKEEDALDIQEFAVALLSRRYTEPEKIKKAKERTMARRTPKR